MFENKDSSAQNLNNNQSQLSASNQGPSKGALTGQTKDIDVHVMPGKFLPQTPHKEGDTKKKASLVVILLVIFLVALIGGGIWFITTQQNTDNEPVNQQVVANENSNTNENNNENSNENSNTNENNNENTNTSSTAASDDDNDGLTQEEEIVFGTKADDDDTDKDGFRDGQEIANLYDPLVPRQSLKDSGLVTQYVNSSFDYSLLIPRSWLANDTQDDGSQVAILSDSEVGDSILVQVTPNTDSQSVTEWRDLDYPTTIFENYTLGGQPALLSDNGLFVLMTTVENKYIIFYRRASSDDIYYPTVFEMIINSFSLEKIPNTIINDES